MSESEPRANRAPISAAPGAVVFERMAAALTSSARLHRRAALLLAAAGGVALVSGLATAHIATLAGGAIAVAMAVFPWIWAQELSERAEGLLVLREDWAEGGTREVVARRRAGLIDLVERLYAAERSS